MINLVDSSFCTQPDNLIGESSIILLTRTGEDLACNFVSPNIESLLGYSDKSLLGSDNVWLDNIHPDDKARVFDFISTLDFNIRKVCYYRFLHKRGDYRWIREDMIKKPESDNDPERIISSWIDVTDYKVREQQLRSAQQHLAEVQKIAKMGNWHWDCSTNALLCSHEICNIFAIPLEESTSIRPFIRKVNPKDRKTCFSTIRSAFRSQSHFTLECRIQNADDTVQHIQIKANLKTNTHGQITSVTGTLLDISEQKHTERVLSRQRSSMVFLAHHDSLTNLPNRICIQDWMDKALHKAQASATNVAVMLIDIDNFKMVNDNYGHLIGDQFLVEFANILRSAIDKKHLIGRLSGDEFVVIIDNDKSADEIARFARNIIDQFNKPITIDQRQFFLTPSIGISMFPDNGKAGDELLRTADVAMYVAKKERNTFKFYSREMDAHSRNLHTVGNELRTALEQNEFVLHYHPQIDLQTGRLVKMEALLRWNHPERGLVSPAEIIPIAEETGMILPIGEWVLNTACRQAREFMDSGINPFCMCINISMLQFKQPELPETIITAIREYDLDPNLFELEITESIAMENADLTIRQLNKIRSMGVRVAIDDFGTGYSSLSHLKHLPISTLKIDRGFIKDILTDRYDSVLIKAILALANSLNLEVVAEGIETEEQRSYLSKLGCQIGQGFLFCKPLPGDLLIPQYSSINAAWCPIIMTKPQLFPKQKRLRVVKSGATL